MDAGSADVGHGLDITLLNQSIADGYCEAAYWKLDRKVTAIANLVGVGVLPFALGAFTVAALMLRGTSLAEVGASLDAAVADGPRVLLSVALVWGVVVVHEATHGLVIGLWGKRPKFGFIHYGLAAYAAAPGQRFKRNQWVVVALAPLVALSALGCVLMPLLPISALGMTIFCLAVNAAGAGADVWLSLKVLRFPPEACVVDEPDGIRLLTPTAEGGSARLGTPPP
jgi:hypothetical protein